ncbi:hypothetical protein ACI495_004416 [Vibrio vulnificus]
MEDQRQVAKSLTELASRIETTIPHAKSIDYLGVSVVISLEVAEELLKAVKLYQDQFSERYVCNDCGSYEVGFTDEQEALCYCCKGQNVIVE